MEVQDGDGWRLAVDRERHPFPVLLGGDGWAAEFTWQEAALIGQGLQRLADQHRALADQLMTEEALSLDWECAGLWLGLEAAEGISTLRFILTASTGARSLEAIWHGPAWLAVGAALAAVTPDPDFCP